MSSNLFAIFAVLIILAENQTRNLKIYSWLANASDPARSSFFG